MGTFLGRMRVPAILPILLLPATALGEDAVEVRDSVGIERNPKLFYVSTTVMTISTTTRCMIASNNNVNQGTVAAGTPLALATCCYAAFRGVQGCRKKRRSLEDEPAMGLHGWIDESPRDIAEQEDDHFPNESPQDIGEEEEEHSRDAKLMLYWVTTTSTTTTYTSTSTLATVNCTPEDWTMLSCTAG